MKKKILGKVKKVIELDSDLAMDDQVSFDEETTKKPKKERK